MLRVADTIALTDTGRQRRDNEDAMLARAPMFVIADGMGGAQAGEVASRVAVETFERGLPTDGAVEDRLATCVSRANRRIYELASADQERHGMGTTLTAVYVDDADLAIAHVGDSRAYLFRDGSLQRLTQDHSLVEELVRRGKLTAEQAQEHPQRSVITRALGAEPTVEVDTWTYPARDGDLVLLCSDGLTSMISEEEVVEVLAQTGELDRAARRLIARANQAGGRDNITVILVRLEEVGDGADGHDRRADTLTGLRVPAKAAQTAAEAQTQVAIAPPPAVEPAEAAVPERASASVKPAPAVPEGRVTPTRRRRGKPMAALVAIVAVLALLAAAGYLATRQLYFIGTNPQGVVTIFRGLPYDLPLDLRLYETFYVSGVPASLVPGDRRGTLFNHRLRSEEDASQVVRDLELGKLSR